MSNVAVRTHSAVPSDRLFAWATVAINGAPRLPMIDIIAAIKTSVNSRVRAEDVRCVGESVTVIAVPLT